MNGMKRNTKEIHVLFERWAKNMRHFNMLGILMESQTNHKVINQEDKTDGFDVPAAFSHDNV